jgi:hypothetical protein
MPSSRSEGSRFGDRRLKTRIRSTLKAARRRGAPWVKLLDFVRLAIRSEGRGLLWTRFAYADEVHQTTPYTREDRYPALFDLAMSLAPDARRILSFGCSTGEELITLRRRFPSAEIVGVEINPRSRGIARRRTAADANISVLDPRAIAGSFDCIFALAVLQREPHKMEELAVQDLSSHYPFDRFNAMVTDLVGHLRAGGLLCVINAQYRVEDSLVASELEPIPGSPPTDNPLFRPDGKRSSAQDASTIFRKRH